jgi:hypothetical protein
MPWPLFKRYLLAFLNLNWYLLLFVAGHPWIKSSNEVKVPLDILILKLMKAYMRSSSLRKAALRVCNAIYQWDCFVMCFDAAYLSVKCNFSFKAPFNLCHYFSYVASMCLCWVFVKVSLWVNTDNIILTGSFMHRCLDHILFWKCIHG